MIGVSFNMQGEKQLSRFLNVTLPKGIDRAKSTFYKDAGDIVIKRSKKIFASGGSTVETGPKWRPLAPSTIAQKAKRGYPSAPLIRTGALASGMKKTVKPDFVRVENKKMGAYGKYHQSTGARKKLPRRLFMELDNRSKSDIMRLLQVEIIKALKT